MYEGNLALALLLSVSLLFIALIIYIILKPEPVKDEKPIYYHRRWENPKWHRRRHHYPRGERGVLRELRRHGLNEDENCHLVCKFCRDRGYEDCSGLYGCDCA